MTLKKGEISEESDKKLVGFGWRVHYVVRDGLEGLHEPLYASEALDGFGEGYKKPDTYHVKEQIGRLYDRAIEYGVPHEDIESTIAMEFEGVRLRISTPRPEDGSGPFEDWYLPGIRKLDFLEERFEIVEKDIEDALEDKLKGDE